jgi:asparagine N-glycosylation enzyme membrane subunit Stt3
VRRPSILALIAFALALALRLANASTAFVSGVPRFSPLDELYHAKRMAFSAAGFPRVLEFDPDRGTRGAWCPWPPLYDLAAGGVARLAGAADFASVLNRVVWFPPLLFAFFVAAVTALVARASGALAGGLAGFALATSPFLVGFSSIGSIDHHFLEPALTFAIAFALIRILRGETCRRRDTWLLAAAMIAAMFVQTALLLACAVTFAVLLFLRPRPLPFLLLAVVVALYALTRPAGYPVSAWFLGWPHAGIFAGAAASLFLRKRDAPLWLALTAGVAVIAAIPAAAEAVAGGSLFLGGDPWLRTISEFAPVLTEPLLDLISDLALLSGGLILVWPLALRAWRTRDRAAGTIALFAIVYLLLVLSSRRFRPLAISFLALAGALEAAHRWGPAPLTARRRPLAILALLLVVVPPTIQLALWMRQPSPPILPSHMPWLRAAAFLQRQPGGGRVLAPWSMGHLLDVIGGRPVIIDNFGSMPDPGGFHRAHDALLEKDEAALAAYCDAGNIRWLVFANPIYELPEAAAVNAIDPEQYIEMGASHEAVRIARLAQATVWWRAYYFGGAARPQQGMFGRQLTHFRAVYADPQPAWQGTAMYNGPALVVWERVKG